MDEKELKRARNTAYRYLTYRTRTRAEIDAKLRGRGFPDGVIHAVLSDLDRLGYINDVTFAGQWAESRIRSRSFGRRRIERELVAKGIDREIVRRELSEVFTPGTEHATAKKAAERKLRALEGKEAGIRRRRLAGFLERKGFSYDIIRDVLNDLA